MRRLHPWEDTVKTKIRDFLATYFGTPPTSPLLDIPEDILLGPHDELFYVIDDGRILGCVRYHRMGYFHAQPMYLVDCFCIHPEFRKKGLADVLLTTLHRFANEHGIPYALFLREGPPLPIWSMPLYTGWYVYRHVECHPPHPCLQHLAPSEAHRLLKLWEDVNPDTLIVHPASTRNQHWRLYRRTSSYESVLACVQDTYQWKIEEDGQQRKMGWITAWLESPNVTEACRSQAIQAIAGSMQGQFDIIWANRDWTGGSTDWMEDGAFSWYAYQWATNQHLKRGYCLIH